MAPITFSANISDIRLESRSGTSARWQIALDHTLFSSTAPTGTLIAIAPSGARLQVPVLGIQEEDGTLWHIVDKPLSEGTTVVGEIS